MVRAKGMSYVELHAHSAFSFGDGASLPDELALAAAERGYEAMALTDHDGVWGAMEFAQACSAQGVRPISGCEMTVYEGLAAPGSGAEEAAGVVPFHLTLLVESSQGWRNLCRLRHRGARGHAAEARSGPPPPRPAARFAGGAQRGARLPLGMRARRGAGGALGARRGASGRGRSGSGSSPRSGGTASGSSSSGRSGGTTGRVTAGSSSWLVGWACQERRHRERPHARAWRAALQDALVAVRLCGSLEETEPQAARQRQLLPRLRGGDGGPLSRPSRRGRRGGSAGRAPSLRPHPRPRLPLSGLGGPRRRQGAGRDLPRTGSSIATRGWTPTTRRRGGWRTSWR